HDQEVSILHARNFTSLFVLLCLTVASSLFELCSSRIFSSTLPLQMKRTIKTSFVCPSRCTRSTAWSSIDGAHQGSIMNTWLAAVRFNPTPPALRENSRSLKPPLVVLLIKDQDLN